MTGNDESGKFSVEKIMKMIRKERVSVRKNKQDSPSTKDKASKIAPYEETLRIKAQNFINQNWNINIHTDKQPFPIDITADEQKKHMEFLNSNHLLQQSFPFKSRFGILSYFLIPFKKILRKTILSSIGELFTRQEQFNSHVVRLLNRQTELTNQIAQVINQLNPIIAKQREMNLNLVSFCNQVNFREDVLTIKSQHTEEIMRELYKRMDNLYVVSNLAYILEEKVNKLQEELKAGRESIEKQYSHTKNQAH